MNRYLILTMLIFLVLQFDCVWNKASAQKTIAQENLNVYKIKVEVRIEDIDQKTSYASLQLFVKLGPLPHQYNETGIWVQILGGYIMLLCNYSTSDSYGKYFEGNSTSPWYFVGEGERGLSSNSCAS